MARIELTSGARSLVVEGDRDDDLKTVSRVAVRLWAKLQAERPPLEGGAFGQLDRAERFEPMGFAANEARAGQS